MNIDILLLLYNRPDFAQKQLEFLFSKVKPRKIFISIDGPKSTAHDEKKINEVLRIATSFKKKHPSVIQVSVSPQNLGCQKGVEKGIEWFFSNVKEGVILEDDCVSDQSFFGYCAELLEKYRDDERVGMISGTNPLTRTPSQYSYFFSHQSIVWGWASWKHKWSDYWQVKKDGLVILDQPESHNSLLRYTTATHIKVMKKVFAGKIDTWDYIWYLTNLLQSRYCVVPSQNLVSNVGFSQNATHTKIKTDQADLPRFSLNFPLKHPEYYIVNSAFEKKYLRGIYKLNILFSIAKKRLGW